MDKLTKYRKQVDFSDQKIIKALHKRFLIVSKIGKFKNRRGIKHLDKIRWQHVLTSKIKLGKKYNLPESFITSIYQKIHKESLIREK